MRRPVAVAVLGELSRSPRMVNHARMLGEEAVLIGYCERGFTPPPGARVEAIGTTARAGDRRGALAFLWISAWRMGRASWGLFHAIMRTRPRAVLLQNPPGLPALVLAWAAARWTRAKLVVDWHNYGYSLLALRLGAGHVVVRAAAWYEGVAGRLADAHYCVSAAMREDLRRRYGISARVLRDRPLERLTPARRAAGPPVVVCPAGWTADEDMELLLDAIERVPAEALEFHLTGDGPTRVALEPRIQRLRQAGALIQTGFLPETDYWARIRSAHAGVSLHRSSSGLDLAMKVVDLHAAGVPVAAFDYGPVLAEQVPAPLRFRTAEELAHLLRHVHEWPAPGETALWREEWRAVAAPLFA